MPPKRDSIRVAVALDCEMGTAASGDSELIRVTLVDYFSEEILIDNLVQPDVPMQHLNTRYSGVSWPDLKKARRNGTCLSGKAGARQAVWEYVGIDTIVVGHGVSNDLRALRWIHTVVVDSLIRHESNRSKIEEGVTGTNQAAKIVVQENLQGKGIVDVSAEFLPLTMQGQADATSSMEKDMPNEVPIRKPSSHSLKALAKKYLNRDIQTSGRRGHDSLEDAVAARDVVHWNVLHLNRDSQA
jgi:RNA exonuclease 1